MTAPDAQVTTTALQAPNLTVAKSVDAATYQAPGDLLSYTITVTNTGNTTLSAVDVTDLAPGPGAFDLDCSGLPSTLAPDAVGTCTATYAVTQSDIDDGAVTNTASAVATAPTGLIGNASQPVTSNADQTSALSVDKAVDDVSYGALGDVLRYTITVTNAGNTTLSAVDVTDLAPGPGAFDLDCSGLPSTLAPMRTAPVPRPMR